MSHGRDVFARFATFPLHDVATLLVSDKAAATPIAVCSTHIVQAVMTTRWFREIRQYEKMRARSHRNLLSYIVDVKKTHTWKQQVNNLLQETRGVGRGFAHRQCIETFASCGNGFVQSSFAATTHSHQQIAQLRTKRVERQTTNKAALLCTGIFSPKRSNGSTTRKPSRTACTGIAYQPNRMSPKCCSSSSMRITKIAVSLQRNKTTPNTRILKKSHTIEQHTHISQTTHLSVNLNVTFWFQTGWKPLLYTVAVRNDWQSFGVPTIDTVTYGSINSLRLFPGLRNCHNNDCENFCFFFTQYLLVKLNEQ